MAIAGLSRDLQPISIANTVRCPCRELRASKTGAPGEEMEVCEGHNLSVADGMVTLLGEGDPSFFERAEEVEEFKVSSSALKGVSDRYST